MSSTTSLTTWSAAVRSTVIRTGLARDSLVRDSLGGGGSLGDGPYGISLVNCIYCAYCNQVRPRFRSSASRFTTPEGVPASSGAQPGPVDEGAAGGCGQPQSRRRGR